MKFARTLFIVAACALLLVARGAAEETAAGETSAERVRFAAPTRIAIGEAFPGHGRHYPSPVFFDMNGDKKLDLVVADLFGAVSVALRTDQGFAKETPLVATDGKPIDFSNW